MSRESSTCRQLHLGYTLAVPRTCMESSKTLKAVWPCPQLMVKGTPIQGAQGTRLGHAGVAGLGFKFKAGAG